MPPSAANAGPLRPTYVEVDLSQLAANFRAIQKHVAPAQVMPVVKANAYGHGLVPVARCMLDNGASQLGVALLDEGLALRREGISASVLVFGGILPDQVETYLQQDLILTVTSIENLEMIETTARRMGKTARVHIKVDTGMGRLGVLYDEADELLQFSLKCTHILVEGIYSHFANSDAADLTHARLQLERFRRVLEFYPRHGLPFPLRHMANSGGILQLPDSLFDMVRPGIMLYGYYPSKETRRSVPISPALTWKTRAVHVKLLPAQHPVSYGSTWQSDHPVHIMTLPLGYGDGYFRSLSNRSQVLLQGKRYPVVGRVCMDQIMVCLEDEEVEVGEEVTLLGGPGSNAVTADDLADWAGTLSYEILTNINTRVPRVYRHG